MTIDTTLPIPHADMGEGRSYVEARPRQLADAARDLRIAGGAPDLAELLAQLGQLIEDNPRAAAAIEAHVDRAMDQLRALATSNVHVALALALDESPQRTDAQLVEKARTAHQTARDALRPR